MRALTHRIIWISRITFLEAIRQRFFAFLNVLGAVLIASALAFRFLDFGQGELKFAADFGFGGMFLFGSILAVVLTAQLFYSEIDNRTALTLLAKPLRRSEFLLGKFFGAWGVLGVFIATLTTLLGVVLWSRAQELAFAAEQAGRTPPAFAVGGLLAYALLQWLRLGVIVAMVLAISAAARTFLFSVIVGALAVLAGQLQWIAQEMLLKGKWTGLEAAPAWLSVHAIPNLQQFNIGDALVLDPAAVPADAVGLAAVSGALYIIVLLGLGCLVFGRREV